MNESDVDDVIKESYERNSPSVDVDMAWEMLRTRMAGEKHPEASPGSRARTVAVSTSDNHERASAPKASAPGRRSGLRVAVYAIIAVVLVAAAAIGSLEAAKHLGKDQPIIVITDDTMGGSSEVSLGPEPVAENSWVNLRPSGTIPVGRYGHTMVYEEKSGRIIMFGGWTIGTVQRNGKTEAYAGTLDDTWSYDPQSQVWTKLAPSGGTPLSRNDHAMAYDAQAGKIILFGGSNSHEPGDISETEQRFLNLGDTWAYDPVSNSWQELTPSVSPPARRGEGLVYDSHRGRVIMFGGIADGGSDLTRFADTWAYDYETNTWTNLEPSGTVPSRMEDFSMAYDPKSDAVYLFPGLPLDAGQVWVYDPGKNEWTQRPTATTDLPKARYSPGVALDEANGRVLVFGGEVGYKDGEDPSTAFANDTWLYDIAANTWSQMGFAGAVPEGRCGPGLAYDPSTSSVIMFGGCPNDPPSLSPNPPLSDTWEYTLPSGPITASQTTIATEAPPTTVRPLSTVVTPEVQGYLDALKTAWTKAGIPVLDVGIVPLKEGDGREIAKSTSESDVLPYVQVEVPASLLEADTGLFAEYNIDRQTIVMILRGVPVQYLAVVTVGADGTKTMDSLGLIGGQAPAPGSEWEQPARLSLEETTQAIETAVRQRAASAGVEITSINVREDDSGRVVTVKATIPDVASADLPMARFGDAVGEEARRLTEEKGAKISEVDVSVDDLNGQRAVRFAQSIIGSSNGRWYAPELWDLVNK